MSDTNMTFISRYEVTTTTLKNIVLALAQSLTEAENAD